MHYWTVEKKEIHIHGAPLCLNVRGGSGGKKKNIVDHLSSGVIVYQDASFLSA